MYNVCNIVYMCVLSCTCICVYCFVHVYVCIVLLVLYEPKMMVTRKLRRRNYEPIPVPDKRRRTSPFYILLTLLLSLAYVCCIVVTLD